MIKLEQQVKPRILVNIYNWWINLNKTTVMRPKLKLRIYSINGTYKISRRSSWCSPANPYELVKKKRKCWRSRLLESKYEEIVVCCIELIVYRSTKVAIYSPVQTTPYPTRTLSLTLNRKTSYPTRTLSPNLNRKRIFTSRIRTIFTRFMGWPPLHLHNPF